MNGIESLTLENCVTGLVEVLRPQVNEEVLFRHLTKLCIGSVLIVDDPKIKSWCSLNSERLLRCLSERRANNDDILALEFDSHCQILLSGVEQFRNRLNDLVAKLDGI